MPNDAFITEPGAGRTLQLGPNRIRVLIDRSVAAFSVIELEAGPGFVAPPVPHWHTREEATFHVLDGAIRLVVDGAEHVLRAGGLAHIRRGVPFLWSNASQDAPARMQCIYDPGGFEQMFFDLAARLEERGVTAPDPALMGEIMPALWRAYGIDSAAR